MFWIRWHCFLHAWTTCKVLCSSHERIRTFCSCSCEKIPRTKSRVRHVLWILKRQIRIVSNFSSLVHSTKKIPGIAVVKGRDSQATAESFSLIRHDKKDWKDTLNKLIGNKCRRKKRNRWEKKCTYYRNCVVRGSNVFPQRVPHNGHGRNVRVVPGLLTTLQDLSQDKRSLGVFCFTRTRTENQKLRRLTLPERQARKKSKRRFYGIFMVAQVAWLRDDEYLTVNDAARNGQAAWARLVL